MSVERRIMALRGRAYDAGMQPVAVEMGTDEAVSLGGRLGLANYYMGLRLGFRSEPGVTVLALPNRRIGKFEVVCPTRFEEREEPS